MVEKLVTAPTLAATMTESPDYRVLDVGLTDRIFLLGHSSAPLYSPYQVVDVQEAINWLEADVNSPLLKALVEAYYGGARDIWLMTVATMDDYEPSLDSRDQMYYQKYADQLQVAYDLLLDWDIPQIIVPVDAPFYDSKGIDFLTPLATHCAQGFSVTGAIRYGVLGTRMSAITDVDVDAMQLDARLGNLGDDGKFVFVIVGEALFQFKEVPTVYTASLAAATAAELCRLPLNQSMVYRKLTTPINIVGNLKPSHISKLADAKLNPATRSVRGERGDVFEVVCATDNTLGRTGSDYWSLLQVRLVQHVIEDVRMMGNRHLGTVGFGEFKREVQSYFYEMMMGNLIRNFQLDIARDSVDQTKVLVNISIQPHFGIRELAVGILVGPGV